MGNKLLLVQYPPMLGDESYFFEGFGYDVTCIYVLRPNDIAYIDNELSIHKHSIDDFDVIVVAVASGPPPDGNACVFPEESIKVLKDKLLKSSLNFSKHPILVGKNWGLSHDIEVSQSEMFGGLFIGRETSKDKIPLILQGIPNIVT